MAMKLALLSILLCSWILAQGHQHNPPDQPRVDLAKLPAPQHMDGLGRAHPDHNQITGRTEMVRPGRRGDALLLGLRSVRAFEQSVRLDPDCAMCHWGIAEALQFRGGADDQVKSELGKAKELSGRASDRDQRIIRAYAGANEKKGDDSEEEVSKALAILVDRYPDDVELRLLLREPQVADMTKVTPAQVRSIRRPYYATSYVSIRITLPPTITGSTR